MCRDCPLQLCCEFSTASRLCFFRISLGYIYTYIYACAGTEERKTRSWPLRAVRLLNSTPSVSRLLTRAFPPPLDTRWRQAFPQLDQTPPRVFPPPQHQTRIREWRRGDRGVAIRPPPALMVILPRIVKHAYPCGQVRKLQWKHRDTSSLSLLFLSHWYDRFFFFFTTPWNEKQKTTDAGIISFSSVVVPLNTSERYFRNLKDSFTCSRGLVLRDASLSLVARRKGNIWKEFLSRGISNRNDKCYVKLETNVSIPLRYRCDDLWAYAWTNSIGAGNVRMLSIWQHKALRRRKQLETESLRIPGIRLPRGVYFLLH